MTPGNLGPKTIQLLRSLKIMKINVFPQHGKDAHRDSAKVALNDRSRSLIWHFFEQIVFLRIAEKVSEVSELTQCCVQLQYRGEK